MAWKYKTVMPKVIGERIELIKPKDLIDLVSKRLDYIYSVLAESTYQIELSNITE